MLHRISATDARIHLGELMRRVAEKEETVIIEHGGKPHTVMISVARYEQLLAAQQQRNDWRELVHRALEQVRADLGERELPPPEEILREIRNLRDEQIVDLR